jgi:hypothetical protein
VSKVKPAAAPNGSPVLDSVKARGRLASMPVRPQFDVAAMAAAGKEADLKTEMLRAQTKFKASALAESSEKPTSPAPLPPSGGVGRHGRRAAPAFDQSWLGTADASNVKKWSLFAAFIFSWSKSRDWRRRP